MPSAGFITPSVITGDKLRPDPLLAIENKVLYVLELTVGFETNLNSNTDRKHKKYLPLISDQESNYDKVKFVNVSISSLGVFGQSTNTLTDMLKELKFDEQQIKYIKKKIIATCIRASYYVFCQRNVSKRCFQFGLIIPFSGVLHSLQLRNLCVYSFQLLNGKGLEFPC